MTYSIYFWDCEENRWEVYERGLSLFGLRPILRKMRGVRQPWPSETYRHGGAWSDDVLKVCRDDLSLLVDA